MFVDEFAEPVQVSLVVPLDGAGEECCGYER
jgi:hypothetical protein